MRRFFKKAFYWLFFLCAVFFVAKNIPIGFSGFFLKKASEFFSFSLSFFEGKQGLLQRIKTLEKENQDLIVQDIYRQSIEFQVHSIESMLERDLFPYTFCLAKVLLANADACTGVLSLGRKHQVKPGYFVLNEKGIIGRVETVSPESCRFIFLTHPDFKMPVISEKTQEQCMVNGNGSQGLSLIYRQTVNPLNEKEVLLSSEYALVCPAGLPVAVWDGANDTLLPCVDFNKLGYVHIAIPDF